MPRALEFACFDVVLAFAALFGLAAFFTLRCRVHSALSPLVSLCSVSLVLAAVFLVIGLAGVYVNLTRRPSMGGHFLFGTGGMLGFSVIFLIASISFYRSMRKNGRPAPAG